MIRRPSAVRWACLVSLTTLILPTLWMGGGAVANAAAAASHTLTVPLLGEIGQPPDPDIYYGSEGEDIIDNTYDTLVQYAHDTTKPTIIGDLATNWKASPNGLVYTFTLHQGVKFHDGTAFNCAAIGPDFARRAAVDEGPAYMVTDVKSVKCPTPYKAVVTLKHAENDFLDGLASEYGPKMMSPKELRAHAGKDHDQTWMTTHEAGTGPYTMVKANATTGYVLKYFPGYWGPKPYYTTVDLPVVSDTSTQQLELESGKASVLLTGLPTRTIASLQSNKKLRVYQLPTEQGTFLNVNPHAPGLGSASVRKAVLDAVDPKTIDNVVYPDGAALSYNGVYPPHMGPTALQKTKLDPTLLGKAASALTGKTITIAYQEGTPNDQQVANLVQTELASGGVTAQVVAVSPGALFADVGKVVKTPSIAVSDPWPDASNPYTWAHIAYDPTGGLSYFQCPDPAAQAALSKAVAIPTIGAASGAYVRAAGDYASTYCWEWLNAQNDVMVAQAGLGGMAQSHSVMAPETLFFDTLTAKGA